MWVFIGLFCVPPTLVMVTGIIAELVRLIRRRAEMPVIVNGNEAKAWLKRVKGEQ